MRFPTPFALGLCALLALALMADWSPAATSTLRVATGVSRPVFATAPPGDTDRLFILEQHTGRIEIMNLATNTISATAFLTIGGLATDNEQGLLGLAFDPDYANNGFFYVNINTAADGGDTHVRRYQVQGDPATSNVANPASGVDILVFNQPQSNHNGGWIAFSPNDPVNLYIASGDGGGGDDFGTGHTPGTGNAQDISDNLLGKMLRINPSREEMVTTPYTIPEDNPLINRAENDEIWAYGLRNPYRDSFDRQTGDLWIGDVGQVAREEIDFQPADSDGGENYGWRLREGTIATPSGGVGGRPPAGNVEPIYDYTRGGGTFQGNVVIGGYVYRGPVEELVGHYIFADGGSHNIWKLDPHAVDIYDGVTRINPDLAPDAGSIANIGSFGEDGFGNLYIMEVFGGEMFKVVSTSQEAVWDGDGAVGTPGDGINWSDANNWTRGEAVDTGFSTDDSIVFAAGSARTAIDLEENRTAASVTFQAPYTLQNNQLQVLSGNVAVDEGVTATIDSALMAESANHSIRKLGAGTLLVEGTAGQTAVLEGTIGGNGTFDHLTAKFGSTVAPGASIGLLEVTNSFTLLNESVLELEIGGTAIGEYDRISIGGAASLEDGILDVQLVDLGSGVYVPKAGDEFGFFVANGGFGTFGEYLFPALEPGLEWAVNPGAITLSISVEIALPGDYNFDGVVGAADYVAWRNTFGNTVVAGSYADGDADGMIGDGDYAIWVENFGNTGQGAVSLVPEPTAALLATVCLLIAAVARRR